MKKIILAVIFLPLVGCTTKEVVYMPATTVETTMVETTVAQTVVTAPPTTRGMTPSQKESLYLMTVKDNGVLDIYFDDSFLLEFGYLVCDFFDRGGTKTELFDVIIGVVRDNNLGDDIAIDFGGAAGAAVAMFCPEYDYMLY